MTEDSSQPTQVNHPTRVHPFVFSGSAREYFPIWIVNLLLTICTLGIYSAWAKVRTLRWFYGHTHLADHSFDYHATGWRILKGRLLALLLIGFMAFLAVAHPLLQLVNVLILAILIPWVINASLRFQLRMTSWRNVRFDFSGSYGRALWIYVGLPLVLMLGILLLLFAIGFGLMANPRMQQDFTESIGAIILMAIAAGVLVLIATVIIIPIFVRMRAMYLAGSVTFGTAPFAVALTLKRLYRLMGRSVLAALAVFLLAVLPFGIMLLWLAFGDTGMGEISYWHWLVVAAYVGIYVAAGVFAIHFMTHVRNETLNQLTIAGAHRVRSTLSPWKILWILCSNGVLASVTLGLMLPWARVRYHRYVCAQITLEARTDLDRFVSANTRAPSSFGGEFGAMEGIDAGFGI